MRLRLSVVSVIVAAVLVVAPHIASATVITFDSLPGNISPIPNGYAGFDWNNFSNLNGVTFQPSGYHNGVVSSPNVAYNDNGTPASFSAATTFDLTSGYFTGAWNDGLTIQVSGYLGATLLITESLTVDTSGPTLHTFNWTGIDRVLFTSSGGTNHGYNGSGTHFALDNLTVNENAPVPEPATVFLVGSGLIVGARFTRRRQA